MIPTIIVDVYNIARTVNIVIMNCDTVNYFGLVNKATYHQINFVDNT